MNLIIENLSVILGKKTVLKDISLKIRPKELHVLMGPNGSGKTTLAKAIVGIKNHPPASAMLKALRAGELRIKNSKIKINNKDITNLSIDERAKLGLFLAFQNPIAIPGVSVNTLLRTAYQAVYKTPVSVWEFNGKLSKIAKNLKIPQKFLARSLDSDFSGGEKKKLEMLQAVVLQPKFAIFDEIDTGLDVDALKIIAKAALKLKRKDTGILLITHYQRILRFIKPDFVHILVNGRIVKSGSYKLAEEVERKGYGKWSK